jgi:hypothetical protein
MALLMTLVTALLTALGKALLFALPPSPPLQRAQTVVAAQVGP